jgi:hypothetical protein
MLLLLLAYLLLRLVLMICTERRATGESERERPPSQSSTRFFVVPLHSSFRFILGHFGASAFGKIYIGLRFAPTDESLISNSLRRPRHLFDDGIATFVVRCIGSGSFPPVPNRLFW